MRKQGHGHRCIEWSLQTLPPKQASVPFGLSSGLEAPVTGWGPEPSPRALATQFGVFRRRGRVAGRGRLSGEPAEGQVGLLGVLTIGVT